MQDLFDSYIRNPVDYNFNRYEKINTHKRWGYYVGDTETTRINGENREHFNKENAFYKDSTLEELGLSEDDENMSFEVINDSDVEVWCGMLSFVGTFSNGQMKPETFAHPKDGERGCMVLSSCLSNLMEQLLNLPSNFSIVDFYNLDFDGVFILKGLNELGFKLNRSVVKQTKKGEKIDYEFKEDKDKSYKLIVKDKRIYQITIKFNGRTVYIRDLMKAMGSFKLSRAVEDFTGISTDYKANLDYGFVRKPLGYLDDKELNYLKFDTLAFNLLAYIIRVKFGINTLTIGSFAFKELKKTWESRIGQYYREGLVDDAPDYIINEIDYLDWLYDNTKERLSKKAIEEGKPLPTEDKLISQCIKSFINNQLLPSYVEELENILKDSYKGGHTYKNVELYAKCLEKMSQYGISIDANSLYPTVMDETTYTDVNGKEKINYYPYGKGFYLKGSYINNTSWKNGKYKTGFVHVKISSFEINHFHNDEHYIPTLRKSGVKSIDPKKYLLTSKYDKGDIEIDAWFTIPDFEYIRKAYKCVCSVLECFLFKGTKDIFKDFISKFYSIKQNNKGAVRNFAKLILNSSYGKLGQRHYAKVENPCYDDGKIVIKNLKDNDGIKDIEIFDNTGHHNMAMASYITSYARMRKISLENHLIENNAYPVYGDTDSLYILCDDLTKVRKTYQLIDNTGWLDSDNTGGIGLWKGEKIFNKYNFVATKKYYVNCMNFYTVDINHVTVEELEETFKNKAHGSVICCGLSSKDSIIEYDCFIVANNHKELKKLYHNGELYSNKKANYDGIKDAHLYYDKDLKMPVKGAFITNKKHNVNGGILIDETIYIMTPKNK